MLPCESADKGPATKVLAASMVTPAKGLMCAAVCPVVLFTLQTVPAAPGTYRKLFASTGWKTGSHPKSDAPLVGGFQSLAKVHWRTSDPFTHVSRASFQIMVCHALGPQASPFTQFAGVEQATYEPV